MQTHDHKIIQRLFNKVVPWHGFGGDHEREAPLRLHRHFKVSRCGVQQKHVHWKRGASAALVHTKYPTLCQIEYGLDGKVRASSHELLLSIEKVRAPRRMLRPELLDFLTGQAEGSSNSRVQLK